MNESLNSARSAIRSIAEQARCLDGYVVGQQAATARGEQSLSPIQANWLRFSLNGIDRQLAAILDRLSEEHGQCSRQEANGK